MPMDSAGPMQPIQLESFVCLTGARTNTLRHVYIRAAAIVSFEHDQGRDTTLVRVTGSEFLHIVKETPSDIAGLLLGLRR